MCVICVELLKQRMSIVEAEKAIEEIRLLGSEGDKQHVEELKEALEELDFESLERIFGD